MAPLQYCFLIFGLISMTTSANLPSQSLSDENLTAAEINDADVRVDCNSDEIVVNIGTRNGRFNGMIYPRGLSKNTHCLTEWVQRKAPITYTLPLRGCNTMSTELDDGGIEYFNTIVVQPHLKLVTNQGKGYHIRCRYTTRNNTAYNEALKMDTTSSPEDPVTAVAAMPGCSMKIYAGDASNHVVAENVKIGDPLSLVVSIDHQDIYGIRVTDCVVKDGLGWGEQKLIDEDGCPTDSEIMGLFKYGDENNRAEVRFKAHKFPYIASVYYQCNVKLCLKAGDGCDHKPPNCGGTSGTRPRRQAGAESGDSEGTPATIEVYSGLYVNEANDLAKAGLDDDSVFSEKYPDDAICI